MRKDLRSNKVIIDWSQNNPHNTTVAVYFDSGSTRPHRVHPGEVAGGRPECLKSGDSEYLRFGAADVLKRVIRFGDVMEPLVAHRGAGTPPNESRSQGLLSGIAQDPSLSSAGRLTGLQTSRSSTSGIQAGSYLKIRTRIQNFRGHTETISCLLSYRARLTETSLKGPDPVCSHETICHRVSRPSRKGK